MSRFVADITEEQKGRVREWIAALRSGEYKQTRGALQRAKDTDEPGFCCLGVACEISGRGSWEPIKEDNAFKYVIGEGTDARTTAADAYLPLVLMHDLGLTTNCAQANGTNLAAMNDSGVTFVDIADILEAELGSL